MMTKRKRFWIALGIVVVCVGVFLFLTMFTFGETTENFWVDDTMYAMGKPLSEYPHEWYKEAFPENLEELRENPELRLKEENKAAVFEMSEFRYGESFGTQMLVQKETKPYLLIEVAPKSTGETSEYPALLADCTVWSITMIGGEPEDMRMWDMTFGQTEDEAKQALSEWLTDRHRGVYIGEYKLINDGWGNTDADKRIKYIFDELSLDVTDYTGINHSGGTAGKIYTQMYAFFKDGKLYSVTLMQNVHVLA